jgi:UPF0176 protein
MLLYNRINRDELIKMLEAETFKRVTVSFYRYVILDDPQLFRDHLYQAWNKLNCFGRIYVAREGINAQMSYPVHYEREFLDSLQAFDALRNMELKYAVEDNGRSFYKLTIKLRKKIVADGLDNNFYDVTNVGKHLSPGEFHELAGLGQSLVIDMRNHYESEVGRFKNAFCPDADTFRDAIKIVDEKFAGQKDRKILLYCTGGIRCEKASAYLRHKGYSDVNQLYGGIIAYAHYIRQEGLESRYTGKNFVFDQRLGESIDGQVIAQCHQCGTLCDSHTNCANDDCHLLFIQCPACAESYVGCCSDECKHIASLPDEERKLLRREKHLKYAESKIFKSRLRPDLANLRIQNRVMPET